MTRRISVVANGAALALGASAGLAMLIAVWPVSMPPVTVAPQSNVSLNLADASLGPGPLSTLTETRDRPLFSPSRARGVPPPDTPAPEQPPAELVDVDTLSLKGTLRQSDTYIGFVRSETHPSGVWVSIGEQLEGWTFEEFSANEARVRRDAEVARLLLYPNADDPWVSAE